jgi:integrase/recombinase XerD
MEAKQPELFPFGNPDAIQLPPKPDLTAESALRNALEPFDDHMRQRELALNTIKAFGNDLKLLVEYLGEDTPLIACTTQRLKAFVHYLEHERDVPCSPKSLHRRITTVKVFFRWLHDQDVLATDPSDAIEHTRPAPRLPQALSDAQVQHLLEVTRGMRDADESPDARPHLLVTLLLDAGIKKGECMGIELQHIDLTEPERPSVYIHYEKPRQRFKSRRLALSPEWPQTLQSYVSRYQPRTHLFECTARNLEYVLNNVSLVAGMPEQLGFETLRWTCALRSFKGGMDPDRLRRKLGLSAISWRETLPMIEKLAEDPL